MIAVRTTEHEISGADMMEQFLVGAYGTAMRIKGDDERRLLRHRRADAGLVAVETAYQSADLQFAVEPLNKLVVSWTSTSRLERASGAASRRYDVGELFLISDPEQPYWARWLPGEIQNCIIDPATLAEVAASAPGRRPAPIRFTSFDPKTPAAAAHWWTTRSYVADLLVDLDAGAAPLVTANAARLLAAVTLATFPNTAVTDATATDRHDAHPATVRRAVAFIDEHAHEDLAIADIAAAAHVTIRAVQLAFRRHLGTTPMAYLRQVRLAHAHRDLTRTDPAHESVTAVAYRWGFPSPSRFTEQYRQAYGVLPSATLRSG